MTGATLRQALAFAARGWPVFPCQHRPENPGHPARRPRRHHRPGADHRLVHPPPDWNLAIATGAPGPDVLDIDEHGPAGNGYAAFGQLRTAGLLDGAAAYIRTPSGGLHLYFRGSDQRNGHLPDCHLDFRSRGGYVLAPPSQVDGRPYQLIRPSAAAAAWTGAPSSGTCNPSPSPSSQAHPQPRPSGPERPGPVGRQPKPKATATRACSGPPTAPWTPTRPPTSAPWPPPPARPAWTSRRSPAP